MEVDPLSHVAARFVHALYMLAALIPYTADDASLDSEVRIACLEDWFTNYRLLIEFLLLKPPSNCASAKTFVPTWMPADAQQTTRLRQDYGWTSEVVSHIGIPKPSALGGNSTPALLRIKARLLFDLAKEFVQELTVRGHAYESFISNGLAHAEAVL